MLNCVSAEPLARKRGAFACPAGGALLTGSARAGRTMPSVSMWDAAVLAPCYHRRLTPIDGDLSLHGLPVEQYKVEVAEMLRKHLHLAVRAPPGCGKTMGLPGMLLRWSPGCGDAVFCLRSLRSMLHSSSRSLLYRLLGGAGIVSTCVREPTRATASMLATLVCPSSRMACYGSG